MLFKVNASISTTTYSVIQKSSEIISKKNVVCVLIKKLKINKKNKIIIKLISANDI